MEAILKEVLQESEARERTSADAATTNPPIKRPSKEPGTTTVLFSKGSLPHCCYCNQQHFSDKYQVARITSNISGGQVVVFFVLQGDTSVGSAGCGHTAQNVMTSITSLFVIEQFSRFKSAGN